MNGNRFQSRFQNVQRPQGSKQMRTNQSDSTMQNATHDGKMTDFSGNKTRELMESKDSLVYFDDLPNPKTVQPARKTVAF